MLNILQNNVDFEGEQFKLKAHNDMLVTLRYCMWYSAKKVKNGTK